MSKLISLRQIVAVCLITSSGFVVAADNVEEPTAQVLAAWRSTIAQTPAPFDGCFHAAYPDTDWTQVDCEVAIDRPFRNSPLAFPNQENVRSQRLDSIEGFGRNNTIQTVGDTSGDWSAKGSNLPDGLRVNATGSFSLSGVTSESDPGGTNDYSVQLNSNYFSSPACNGQTGCTGWEQFVYSTSLHQLLIQFWLVNYSGVCPSGFSSDGAGNCSMDSPAASVPALAATGLGTLSMYVTSAGYTLSGISQATSVNLTIGSNAYSTYDVNFDTLGLTQGWSVAEFNVFGDGNLWQANFNAGSYITVATSIRDETTAHPNLTNTTDSCFQNSTTGETNNLNLGTCTAYHVGGLVKSPYISFTEHN